MTLEIRPVILPPNIPDTITYLERQSRGEEVGRSRKNRQIEDVYFLTEQIHQIFSKIVKIWGDSPSTRQILYFHYLQKESLLKELLVKYIYPSFIQNRYELQGSKIKSFFQKYGLTESEQVISLKNFEKALIESKMLNSHSLERSLEYQRPTIEAVAYAFYAEYGEGFELGRRFYLKNPPLEQIVEHAAFPAYFLLDPRAVPTILEACRMKNYISLEARGGLCQYPLIYQDLTELVEFMVRGGCL